MFNYQLISVTSAGGTVTINPKEISSIALIPDTTPLTLLADMVVSLSGSPANGLSLTAFIGAGIQNGGNKVTIGGVDITQEQLDQNTFIELSYIEGSWVNTTSFPAILDSINGGVLIDETVSLDKLGKGTSAQTVVCDGSGNPQYVTVSGDATLSNAGAITIANSAITNAKVSAIAAISRSKLASGSASQVLVNDVSGVMSSEAQLSPVRGGLGTDASSSTGFVTFSGGTASIGAIYEVVTLLVSFESGYLGDFKIMMPYAGTVTEIYAYATKVIAGTDDGTITPKNNGGTTMTDGVLTFVAADPRGSAYSVTPSANNTFAAGDLLTFTTAKTTAGGVVQLSIMVTRNS